MLVIGPNLAQKYETLLIRRFPLSVGMLPFENFGRVTVVGRVEPMD